MWLGTFWRPCQLYWQNFLAFVGRTHFGDHATCCWTFVEERCFGWSNFGNRASGKICKNPWTVAFWRPCHWQYNYLEEHLLKIERSLFPTLGSRTKLVVVLDSRILATVPVCWSHLATFGKTFGKTLAKTFEERLWPPCPKASSTREVRREHLADLAESWVGLTRK